MIRVGQKVTRKDDYLWDGEGEIAPVFGEVYTVRDMFVDDDGIVCLQFHEIRNQPREYKDGFIECGFEADAFCPVVDCTTDISVFTKILDNARRKQPA